MRKQHPIFFISLLVGAIVLVALNVFWLHWFRPHTAAGSKWSLTLLHDSGRLHDFVTAFSRWGVLAKENNELKDKLQQATENQADADRLQRENNQLRAALDLPLHVRHQLIPAGMYTVSLSPDGYTALINKGIQDKVAVGDILVDGHNALVGMVQAVFTTTARITLVSDPSFKVTVVVLGGSTKGIAHGVLERGLTLDLVVQSDELREGDTLVSSGNDTVPAGLVLGPVTKVESNNAKLFKEVTVTPSAQFVVGDVFVVK